MTSSILAKENKDHLIITSELKPTFEQFVNVTKMNCAIEKIITSERALPMIVQVFGELVIIHVLFENFCPLWTCVRDVGFKTRPQIETSARTADCLIEMWLSILFHQIRIAGEYDEIVEAGIEDVFDCFTVDEIGVKVKRE